MERDSQQARKPKTLTLDELLSPVMDENLHDEVDFDPPIGNEVVTHN